MIDHSYFSGMLRGEVFNTFRRFLHDARAIDMDSRDLNFRDWIFGLCLVITRRQRLLRRTLERDLLWSHFFKFFEQLWKEIFFHFFGEGLFEIPVKSLPDKKGALNNGFDISIQNDGGGVVFDLLNFLSCEEFCKWRPERVSPVHCPLAACQVPSPGHRHNLVKADKVDTCQAFWEGGNERNRGHLELSGDPLAELIELLPVEVASHHAGVGGQADAEEWARWGRETCLPLSSQEELDVLKRGRFYSPNRYTITLTSDDWGQELIPYQHNIVIFDRVPLKIILAPPTLITHPGRSYLTIFQMFKGRLIHLSWVKKGEV